MPVLSPQPILLATPPDVPTDRVPVAAPVPSIPVLSQVEANGIDAHVSVSAALHMWLVMLHLRLNSCSM